MRYNCVAFLLLLSIAVCKVSITDKCYRYEKYENENGILWILVDYI